MTRRQPTCARSARAATLAIAMAAALSATPAQAVTTYTYTAPITACANNYVGWFYNYACGALDGSGIRIEFTTAAPLVQPSFGAVTSEVLAWSFHGGTPFLNLDSSTPGNTFHAALRTDAAGHVVDHAISIGGAIVIPTLEAYTSSVSIYSTVYDQETVSSDYLRASSGPDPYNGYQPRYAGLSEGITNGLYNGTWQAVTAVPEPATWALMLTALAGMGAVRKRRG